MKNRLIKSWGKFLLLGLLLFIVIINFKWGYFILGNDNYSPEESPLVSIGRLLVSPAWRDYRGLGVPSDSEQVDIFRSGLYLVLNSLRIPLWFISQFGVFLVFFLGTWSIANLSLSIFKKKLDNFGRQSLFLLTGVFYFTNILTLWLFFSPLKPFIYVWGFLPFFLWQSWELLVDWNLKRFFIFLVAVLLISTSAIIPTIFLAVLMVVVGFYVWFYLLGNKLKKLFLIFGVFIIFQCYWLIPFGFYVKSNATGLTESYINRIITPGTIQDELKYNTLGNVVRYYTSWLETKNDNGEYLFKYSPMYQNGSLFSYLAFLPIIFVVLFLFKNIKSNHRKVILPLVILLVGGIFLIKRDNLPFGFVYKFFEDNIPLFRQVFRWGSSKFWPFLSITIPILASLFFVELTKKYPKIWRWGVLTIVFGCQIIFVWPVLRGDLVNKIDFVRVPGAYYELKNYLKEVDRDGRIYLAPEVNNLYFRNHDWGFFGSVFWSYLIPNPIIEKSLTTGSGENEAAFDVLVNSYYSQDPEFFFRSLNNYKIKWVLVDKSVTDKNNGYKYNWDAFSEIVELSPYLTKVWQKDFLSLYKVKDNNNYLKNDLVYFDHDWSNLNKLRIFDKRDENWISIGGNYGKIFPLYLKPNKLDFNERSMVLGHYYKGKDMKYNLSLNDTKEFPTSLIYENGKVNIRPAIPEILVNKNKVSNNQINYSSFELSKQIDLISFKDEIWNFKVDPKVNMLGEYGEALMGKDLFFWRNTNNKTGLSNGVINVENDLIIKVNLSSNSRNLWKNVCIQSDRTKECLNNNISAYFSDGKLIESDYILLKGPDVIRIFLPDGVEIKAIDTWEKINSFKISLTEAFKFETETFEIKNGDLLEVKIPILKSSENSFELQTASEWIPEYIGKADNILTGSEGLKIKNQDGVSGFYLNRNSPYLSNTMMLVVAEAENSGGIPIDLNFRNTKEEYKLWTERMGYLKNDQVLETFMLPKEWKNYIFEAIVWARGRDESVNKISNLIIQPIPRAWNRLSLVPEILEIPEVIGINKAKHEYWSASYKGESLPLATVNGWEQAFVVNNKEKELKVNYWPNRIVWLGWLVNGLVIIAGVLYFRLKKKVF